MFRDDGTGGDDGAFANAGIVENDGADADEAGVFNNAAVYSCVVADGDRISHDDGVFVAHAVEHGTILDVAAGADANGMNIPAQDGIHPDAGVFTEGHIADDLCRDVYVTGIGINRGMALVRADHEVALSGMAAMRIPALLLCRTGTGYFV